MSLPLSDIRVVEITQLLAGPVTAMLLADQGADVIKIEPLEGDASRRMGALSDADGFSLGYLSFNRNKRGIALDVHKSDGRELFYELVRKADVLVTNLRVGARQRGRFTYEDLAAINSKLIYASITGYGEEGPEVDLPAADITIQARVGDIASRRLLGGPLPPHTSLFHYDVAAAILTFGAIVVALRERERTGRGQKVEVNLLHTAMLCQLLQMTRAGNSKQVFPVLPTGLPNTYLCSDGRYILDQTINIGPRWEDLCYDLGLDDLAGDPRFDTVEKRQEHLPEITAILSNYFLTRPAAEWDSFLKAHNHLMSMVKEIDEVNDDPQVVANHMMTQFEQPGLGTVREVNVPFKLSGSAAEHWFRRHTPALGEHTVEVLRELGYSQERIKEFKAQGVVA